MSSILDALRKLEAEKQDAQRVEDATLPDDVAERELVGRDPLRERLTIRMTPVTLMLAAAAAVVVLLGISVGISMMVLAWKPAPETQIASVEPAPVTKAAVETIKPDLKPAPPAVAPKPAPILKPEPPVAKVTPPPKEPESVKPPEGTLPDFGPSSKPAEPVDTAPEKEPRPGEPSGVKLAAPTPEPAPQPEQVAAPAPEPAPQPEPPAVTPQPEPAPAPQPVQVAQAVPAPPMAQWQGPEMNVRPPAAPEAAKTPPPADAPALDIDYSKLPVLTQAIRKKLDLDELRINMLRPVDTTRPYASALINLNTVYVGEAIPRTRARLVAVDGLKGIVIEFEGSQERFYVRF